MFLISTRGLHRITCVGDSTRWTGLSSPNTSSPILNTSKSNHFMVAINVWKSYVSYAIQEYTESIEYPENDKVVDILFLRTLFRKADKATGHHISQSHIVWDIQRDFELQQLSAQVRGYSPLSIHSCICFGLLRLINISTLLLFIDHQ